MKKRTFKIISALLLATVLACLTSCFDSSTEDNSDVTVFSNDKTVYVVTAASAGDVELDTRNQIANSLKKLGLTVETVIDIFAPADGYFIYVGDTGSAATAYAKAQLAEAGIIDDNHGYVIAVTDGTLAVYANSDYGYEMALSGFLKDYTSDKTLVLSDSHVKSEKITAEEYAQIIDGLSWENRWDYTEKKHGTEVVKALKRIYDFYGDSVYQWIANLYDIENGGFYYANSARDYDGFLPDIESTTQALWFITASGLTKHLGNDLTVALPEEIVEQTLNFAYSLYDDSDGYFYHKQWGKNIGSERRGRDLNSSIDVIRKLGGEVPENTALDRLEGGTASAVSKVTAVSSVRPTGFLSSQSELLSWLENRKINTDSHGAGHTIESSASQIKAAGYAKFVIDWLDSKQLETGLWQEINDKNAYQALSGLLKIGSCYSKLGGQMKNCEAMVDTAIRVIKMDLDPSIVIYVYNPWGALKYALSNIKSANATARANNQSLPYDYDAEFNKVISEFPSMINATIDKLALFQKSDGSFSYYQANSAAYTQGTHVSLGKAEGDVNGTSLGMTTMYTTFYEILGTPVVPLYNADDYNKFIEIITTLEPVAKTARPRFEPVDFENGKMGEHISTYATTSGSSKAVEDDGDGNMALHVISPTGIGDQITFKADSPTDEVRSFAYEFSLRVDSGSGYLYQISLLNSTGGIATMMTVNIKSGKFVFADTSSNAYYTGAVTFNEISVSADDWIDIRMEYHLLDDDTTRLVLYVNDEFAGESDNYYGKFAENGSLTGTAPKTEASRLQIYSMLSSNVDYWLDNFNYEFSMTSTYEG